MSDLYPSWKRIAGLHVQDDGLVAAAWMAHDQNADCLHLYDACRFQPDVLAVLAEGLNRRGKWIPIAWHKEAKELSSELLDRGCNMLPDQVASSQSMAEVTAREIEERMRTSRFKASSQLEEWIEEFRTYQRQENKVPLTGFPLMTATRHAVASLEWASAAPSAKAENLSPKLAIV